MEVVLQQINKIQGIAGCFVCDEDGKLLGQALPPMYDDALLQEASGIIADSVVGVNAATGGVVSFDLRFSEGRIIVRPVQSSYLLLLCEQKINVQLLNMSLSVAQKKLEKAIQAAKENPVAVQGVQSIVKPNSAPAIAPTREIRLDGKGVILTVEPAKNVSQIQWDMAKEEVAISRELLKKLFTLLKTGSIKKLKLINRGLNRNKTYFVVVFDSQPGQMFDDKIILPVAAFDALTLKPGDDVSVEVTTSGVFDSDVVLSGWD